MGAEQTSARRVAWARGQQTVPQIGGVGARPWKLLKSMQKSLGSVMTLGGQASARIEQGDRSESKPRFRTSVLTGRPARPPLVMSTVMRP